MSTIHVVIHFLAPIDKTFTFTEPDSLELGRSSGIIQDQAISKKQVLFEIVDGRVYAIANKYPFKVTITKLTNSSSNLQNSSLDNIESQNSAIIKEGFSSSLLHNNDDHEYDELETPSQLLREMISSQGDLDMIPNDDNDNALYNDDRESSDNGAEIHDNEDDAKSVASDNKMFSSESSYLGSSCESSKSDIE
ncbi:8494_t:CDS:2, partial [Scutellospora calospora]